MPQDDGRIGAEVGDVDLLGDLPGTFGVGEHLLVIAGIQRVDCTGAQRFGLTIAGDTRPTHALNQLFAPTRSAARVAELAMQPHQRSQGQNLFIHDADRTGCRYDRAEHRICLRILALDAQHLTQLTLHAHFGPWVVQRTRQREHLL